MNQSTTFNLPSFSKAVVIALTIASLTLGCAKSDEGGQSVEQNDSGLFVGMCFNDASPEDTVMDENTNAAITNIALESLSCQGSHDNEVYFIHSLPEKAKARLEGEAFFEEMLDVCEAEFEDYIGKSYKDSFYEMSVLFPTTESWDQGHKQAVCYAFHPEAKKLDFSLKGINE